MSPTLHTKLRAFPRRVRTRSIGKGLCLWTVLGMIGMLGCAEQNARNIAEKRPKHKLSTAWKPARIELFPGVRIDPDRQLVEFEAQVSMDCHDPQTPDVYLEVLCCVRNSREYESLVVTDIKPSLIHAAMLAVGLEPGAPGILPNSVHPAREPTGQRVEIRFVLVPESAKTNPAHPGSPIRARIEDPTDWIVQKSTKKTLRQVYPQTAWVFAGSRIRLFQGQHVYDADWTGQLIGLHTFGSETIAWTRLESPQASVTEPEWLADAAHVPALGRPVIVQIYAVPKSQK